MIKEATALLLKAQNTDGGWGSVKGKRSNTEATSLAVMALESLQQESRGRSIREGVNWLAHGQNSDGSWPLNDTSQNPSWTTALAILALSLWPDYRTQVFNAARWVLRQKGSKPGLLANLLLALTFKKKAIHLNEDLIGWPWLAGTFSWVEPTSYYLIALKKVRSKMGGDFDERIKQGKLMIYDRMCRGGGWNYGNSVVFDENLWPYPDTTAVALIALQDHREAEANRQSLEALKNMLRDVHSGLALSWGIICLSLYGEDTGKWKELLAESFKKTQFLGENKVIALSLLALNDGAKFFKI